MVTELDGRALDEALFRALQPSAEIVTNRRGLLVYRCPEGWGMVPEFHTSLDALLRDVWPECQRRGWQFVGIDNNSKETWWGFLGKEGSADVFRIADTPALALARAMLAALQEGE